MKVLKTIKEMQDQADHIRASGRKIGFVPTMGALHEGHLSLIRLARQSADVVVMSIYVNPAQFGPDEDYDLYPRNFAKDESLARQAGADIIFYPDDKQMYPEPFLTDVAVHSITENLCGASRPGHFQGVAVVCAKLFNIVKPHFAVFGQKDAQQAAVIRQMARDLNFDMEIITAPIVREPDGLAMSSRNAYLSSEERQDALSLNQALRMSLEAVENGERSCARLIHLIEEYISAKKNTTIDYVKIADPFSMNDIEYIKDKAVIAVAVFLGKTRLIDNVYVEVQDEARH